MLFLCYWELNENMPSVERMQVANRLTSSGLFPPEGVKIVRWDETPDGWGILLFEAESAQDAAQSLELWRAAGAGFFKMTKTAPAVPIEELMPVMEKMFEALAST
jgi:hypothetical protein